MTQEKRRRRGSRTHGGGSQKNRRGAGNRGGRGNAGRKKHEIHGADPLGKKGFTRPPSTKEEVVEVSLQEIDEYVFYEVGTPGRLPSSPVRVNARELIDDIDSDTIVKVLADGRRDDGSPKSRALMTDGGVVRATEVVANEFSKQAVNRLEAGGGRAVTVGLNGHKEIKTPMENVKTMEQSDKEYLNEKEEQLKNNELLSDEDIHKLLEIVREEESPEIVYDILYEHYDKKGELETDDIVDLYRYKTLAKKHEFQTPAVNRIIEDYFSDIDISEEIMADLTEGIPDNIPVEELSAILDYRGTRIKQASKETYPEDNQEDREERIEKYQKEYLYIVQDRLTTTA